MSILLKKKKSLVFQVACCVFVGSLLSGCARTISSGTYSSRHVGETSRTEEGTIISMRFVEVKDHEKLEENGLGIIGGALGGGLLGSLMGKGNGKAAMTGVGALAGAAGGALLQDQMTTQQGVEYVVKLNNGSTQTVVQGPEPLLKAGQKVYVMISHKGRSRVVPL